MASNCMVNWELIFSPLLNCCIQIWKLGYEKSEPGLTYTRLATTPMFSLGIVDCWLYTRRFARKNDYHKKRMNMFAYTALFFNFLETLPMTFIIPARQNQFFLENIFNNAPVHRIVIAMNTNSALTDRALEIHSCINNLISDKVEDSVSCRIWCCQKIPPIRYDNEDNEISRWYPLNSTW